MKNIKNPLIFVVEDNPVYNSLITGALKANKYKQVHSFSSTEDCLSKISLQPDIVVLNYAYSGFTGLDLMRKVHETYPDIAFIFLSGQNDVETAVRIIKLGASDYIVKGEKAPERLIRAIDSIQTIERRETVRQGLKKGTIYVFIILLVVVAAIIILALSTNIFGF